MQEVESGEQECRVTSANVEDQRTVEALGWHMITQGAESEEVKT